MCSFGKYQTVSTYNLQCSRSHCSFDMSFANPVYLSYPQIRVRLLVLPSRFLLPFKPLKPSNHLSIFLSCLEQSRPRRPGHSLPPNSCTTWRRDLLRTNFLTQKRERPLLTTWISHCTTFRYPKNCYPNYILLFRLARLAAKLTERCREGMGADISQ